MVYSLVPIGLTLVFVVVVLYLLVIKKDFKKLRDVLLPGISFMVIWAVIYYLLLK